ncbi:hypothetical protein JOF36_007734 [Pseudonocardia parietis]|uniref:Uncharacterized protein n=1 Tax=Pseudonocardia parietis TaxID=570936 RepID=A0ABS4W6Z6_9PSEU|nr:hypothetical protein [Pseudonocardia parietis]
MSDHQRTVTDSKPRPSPSRTGDSRCASDVVDTSSPPASHWSCRPEPPTASRIRSTSPPGFGPSKVPSVLCSHCCEPKPGPWAAPRCSNSPRSTLPTTGHSLFPDARPCPADPLAATRHDRAGATMNPLRPHRSVAGPPNGYRWRVLPWGARLPRRRLHSERGQDAMSDDGMWDRRAVLRAAGLAASGPFLLAGCGAQEPGLPHGEPGPPVPPTEELMRQHGLLNRILVIYDAVRRRLATDQPVPATPLSSNYAVRHVPGRNRGR